jgi:hypothetical protein
MEYARRFEKIFQLGRHSGCEVFVNPEAAVLQAIANQVVIARFGLDDSTALFIK